MTTADATSQASPTRQLARFLSQAASALFLASIVSLPFMQPLSLKVLGSAVQVADALFAVTGAVWALSVALGGAPLRKGRFYALLGARSEEHTSELQSQFHLVCRLLLEKKKRAYNSK